MLRLQVGPWKWWYAIIGLAIVLVSLAVPALLLITGVSSGVDDGIMGVAQFTVMILLVLVIFRLLRRGRLEREEFGLVTDRFLEILLVGIGGALLYILLGFVFRQMVPEAKDTTENFVKMLGIGMSVKGDLLQILSICIAAPIGEELLFRGILFRSLYDGLQNIRRRTPVGLPLGIAGVFSAGAFMLSHAGSGQDASIIMFFVLGFICCLAYVFTGSLYASVLVHSFNNSVVLFVILLGSGIKLTFFWMYGLILAGPIIALLILKMIEVGIPSRKKY